jgi:hypothetical protein
MKRINLAIMSIGLVGVLGSCDSGGRSVSAQVEDFSEYVDSVSQEAADYSAAKWADVKEEYNQQVSKLDSSIDRMKNDERAEYADSKEQYAQLEAEYAKKRMMSENRRALEKSLMGEVMTDDNMQMSFVTADNILSYYKRFVETVEDHQNEYSREEWDQVKALYEALDNRKNEVEKDLSSRDNNAIAKLKIKFSAIKTIKRPFAEKKADDDAK